MCRWRARLWLASVLCGGAVLAQQAPVFRADVSLVRVIATAKNQAGDLVGALQKSDFQVFDNGAWQEIAVFERQTEMPLSVALLVDTSGSTAKELKYEIDSAARFLHALLSEGNPEDTAALYNFNFEVTRKKFYTHNYASLESSLKTLHGDAGTAMYDAIYLAAGDLESRAGRKVIVIVTDGGDTTSTEDLKGALEAAQLADAVIYPVVVMPITNDAGRNIGGEHALQFMAEGTGGRTFFPAVGAQLDKVFSDIITELRTQYLLAFYPHDVPLTKERFHKLEVRVNRPDLRVSARNGYYGEVEGGTGTPGARTSIVPEGQKKRQKK
ncbi:MAG: VWA domain-containing protein [Bryobacteraceae bacterium]